MSSQEQTEAANRLFRTFLNTFTLSEDERVRMESALFALPIDLKEAVAGKIDHVVLFPFGTFYHGLGFRNDPLTAFVGIGRREGVRKGYKKLGIHCRSKTAPVKEEESESEDTDDDNSSTGSIHSSGSECSSSEVEEIFTSYSWNQGGLRQTLLLNLKDALTARDNALSGSYQEVTLTRHGKLHYRHHERGPTGRSSYLSCLLDAKSFLPVQTSRLIKFYCVLEPVFWPFSLLVLNWAKNNLVVEQAGKADLEGLKTDHLLSLVIFFLVRRRILPSFQLLQQWSTSQLIVEDINVGFCENLDLVRASCLESGIGSCGLDEGTFLERTLQLLCEFFNEMATFNFAYHGVSPSTGTSFSKYPLSQFTVTNPNNRRKLDTNSLICIQDILDKCQNVTRKVNENWVLKFRSRSRATADRLFGMLWNGDVLNAILCAVEVDVTFGDLDDICAMDDNWEGSLDPEANMSQQRRCIRFSVPHSLLGLLNHCYDLAENMGVLGGDLDSFIAAAKILFRKFMEEFNGVFWNKFVAAHTMHTFGGSDPVNFGTVEAVQCPAEWSREEMAISVVKSVMDLFASGATQDGCEEIVRFYVKSDWTKDRHRKLLEQVNKSKSKIDKLVNSLLGGMASPQLVCGKRSGPPKAPQIMAVVELEVRFEEGGLSLYTFVKCNESPEDADLLNHCLDWYNVIVKNFIVKKFITWMGCHVIEGLEEKYSILLAEKKSEKRKAKEEAAAPTIVHPPVTPSGHQSQYVSWNGVISPALTGQPSQPYNRDAFINSRTVKVTQSAFHPSRLGGQLPSMPIPTPPQPMFPPTSIGRGRDAVGICSVGRGRDGWGTVGGPGPVSRGAGVRGRGTVGRGRGSGPGNTGMHSLLNKLRRGARGRGRGRGKVTSFGPY